MVDDVMIEDVEAEDLMEVVVKKGICPSQGKMWSGIEPESRSSSSRMRGSKMMNLRMQRW